MSWELLVDKRWKHKLAPAFPFVLLKNRLYAATMLLTVFLGFPFMLTIYAFPLRVQVVNGKSALTAGLLLLPLLGAVSVGSLIAGGVNAKKNRLCETMIVGSILLVLGCALETTLSASVELEAKSVGLLVFIGLGIGITGACSSMVASVMAPIREHAPAQGIIAQMRIFGGSIGIAASSAILAVQTSALPSLESSTATLTPAQLQATRQAYADAYTEDMKVSAAVAGVAVLIALSTYQRDRPTMIKQRQRQVKEESDRKALA